MWTEGIWKSRHIKHRKTTFRSYVLKPWFNHALVGFHFRSSGDQTNYNPELCLTNRGGYSWLYDNDLCEFGSKMWSRVV